jgi:hypothetical protein
VACWRGKQQDARELARRAGWLRPLDAAGGRGRRAAALPETGEGAEEEMQG